MLGGVESNQIDMIAKDQAGLLSSRIDPGLICDKTDSFPSKEIKVIMLEDINSEIHGSCVNDQSTGKKKGNKEFEDHK